MAINYELINKGGISLGTNFELLSEKPLDSRLVVPSLEGLQNYIDSAAAYEGMIAYVTSEKKHYEVKTIDGILSYRQFGLTNDELNELIASATTAAMEFKGAATTLPENPTKGDMYKVTAFFKVGEEDAKVGDSIVYDGTQWFLIPSGDDIEDTWRPVTDVKNDATLTFVAGDKLDVAVAATGEITYKHEAIAAPANVTAEGDEKTRTYITAVETDGFGHITGYKTATENMEDTNTTYGFEGQAEKSNVYFQVTASEEGASAETVYLDAYSKNETDKAIGDVIASLDAEVSQPAGADGLALSITEVDGKITKISGSIKAETYDAYGAAADAKSEVIGTSSDDKTANTIYGAKAYADALTDIGDDRTYVTASDDIVNIKGMGITLKGDVINLESSNIGLTINHADGFTTVNGDMRVQTPGDDANDASVTNKKYVDDAIAAAKKYADDNDEDTKYTAKADGGLKLEGTEFSVDDSLTWIFDCGTSAN